MTLERRLTDALHSTYDYAPSTDLFARLTRSIEEDRRHRARVRWLAGGATIGVAALVWFAVAVSSRTAAGDVTWPKWSVQVAMAVVMVSVLVALGPAIRRMGKPLIDDVFHATPSVADRFGRLLDIAYYLSFGAAILLSVDLSAPGLRVLATSDVVAEAGGSIARFLLLLGMAHTINLLALPLLGLIHASSMRRTRRRTAGADAPPASEEVRRAELVVRVVLVVVVGALAVAGAAAAAIVVGFGFALPGGH